MGSQTPIYTLPYPVGTDRVADGDNAMQSLAEAVEDRLRVRFAHATSPNTPAPNNAWSAVGWTTMTQEGTAFTVAPGGGRITAKAAGLYLVSGTAAYAPTNNAVAAQIRVNAAGSPVAGLGTTYSMVQGSQQGVYAALSPYVVRLAANDYVEMLSWSNGPTTYSSPMWMQIRLLSLGAALP